MSRTSKIALACILALGAAGSSIVNLGGAVAQQTQPEVRMARDLVAAASAFETYTRTASRIDAGFRSPKDVAGAVEVAASHEPHQLETGMIAYAAMAALQDPRFVGGVQRIVADGRMREVMIRRLRENPESAIELPGAEEAAGRARQALLRQVEPLLADGRRVKQAAYDIQHQSWSKVMVGDPRERLALVKQLALRPFAPGDADAERLYQALTAHAEAGPGAAPSPVVARGLALAALALAGEANEENGEALRSLVSEPRTASCMHMAKLNLFQCMAVAGPHYEDVFCISQHAMLETGQCMASAAGAEAPPTPASREMQTAQARSLLIPVAGPARGER
jgi:hypothetical protein